MAIEYITILDGLGAQKKVAADVFNTDEYAQLTKVAFGADGTATLVEPTVGLPVRPDTVTSVTTSRVGAAISATTLVGANANRRGLTVYAEAQSAILYLKEGTAVTTSVYEVALPPYGYWEMPAPIYTGTVTAIWSAVDGAALISER